MSTPEEQRPSKGQGRGNGGMIPPVEYRWKKGQSGNPGGRPKGSGVTGALRRLLQQIHNGKPLEELVAERWLKEALSGKPAALQLLLDRTEGKVTDKLSVSDESSTVRILVEDARGNTRECASLRELYATTPQTMPPPPPPGGEP